MENGVLHWHLGDLPAGAKATLTLKVSQTPPGRVNALAALVESPIRLSGNQASAFAFVDVPAVPSISIQPDELGSGLRLTWPGADPRWRPQSAGVLSGDGAASWHEVTQVPEGNEIRQVILPHGPGAGSQFYRLIFELPPEPTSQGLKPVAPCLELRSRAD